MMTMRHVSALTALAFVVSILAACSATPAPSPAIPTVAEPATDEPPQDTEEATPEESASPHTATPEPPFDYVGTTWHSDGATSSKGCENTVTFVGDGTFDYTTRCHNDTDWRSYFGDDDNSTWSLVGTTMRLSYKDGFNVCEGPATPELIDLRCLNKDGDDFARPLLPSP